TNTWQISGGIDFIFPLNFFLPPNAGLLLVDFYPVHEAEQLSQFCAPYGLRSNAKLLCPHPGSLCNTRDKNKLLKPDVPQTLRSPNPGFVPYVLVDEVDYANAQPWPANANATGLSLQRIGSTDYGNDPVNWLAAQPTAAQPNLSVLPSLSISI